MQKVTSPSLLDRNQIEESFQLETVCESID